MKSGPSCVGDHRGDSHCHMRRIQTSHESDPSIASEPCSTVGINDSCYYEKAPRHNEDLLREIQTKSSLSTLSAMVLDPSLLFSVYNAFISLSSTDKKLNDDNPILLSKFRRCCISTCTN